MRILYAFYDVISKKLNASYILRYFNYKIKNMRLNKMQQIWTELKAKQNKTAMKNSQKVNKSIKN